MKKLCEPLESLVQAQALPPDHPRRLHLENCARCRARLLALQVFKDDESIPDGADLADANQRLSATVQSIHNGGNHRFRNSVLPSGILALAAVVALFIFMPPQNGPQPLSEPGQVLRGTPTEDSFVLSDSTRQDGGLDFSWLSIPGAQEYRVIFYDAALGEIKPAVVTTDTFFSLSLQSEKPVFWKVIALAKGDPLFASEPKALAP